MTELDGESVASGDEDSESELKLLPGQMHVSGRKKGRAVVPIQEELAIHSVDGGR